jgi:hypothetical protein
VTALIRGVWERKEILCREQGGIDTPLILSRKLTILLPTLTYYAIELLKASLNAVVAEERAPDGPEDLTGKTTT